MSKKREIEALSQRLMDLAAGANGGTTGVSGECLASEDYCLAYELGIANFGLFLSAMRDVWPGWSNPGGLDITDLRVFDRWDRPLPEVVEWLYGMGVRADRDRDEAPNA